MGMRGIVTYDRRDLRVLRDMGLLPGDERTGAGEAGAPNLPFPLHVFYEIKSVLGRVEPPLPGAHNMISCFGDNRAVEADPGLAAAGPDGLRAVRGTPYFDWDWVCPSEPAYRRWLLELVERAAAADIAGLRLDTVSFPREGFCRCPRCRAAQAASGLGEEDWRAAVIAGFVREALARAGAGRPPAPPSDPGPGSGPRPGPRQGYRDRQEPGRAAGGGSASGAGGIRPAPAGRNGGTPTPSRPLLSLTLYPDPYGDHQFRRFGVDVAQLAPLVDFFVVPIYDLHYSTTYWVESLAWGFRDLLGDTPFVVELYALNVDRKALLKAARVADAYADGILLAYERAPEALAVLEELGPTPARSRLG